jgi:tRNA pseudouridine38-40 synthase
MQNYRITIQYVGASYSGWQIQDGKATIQGELERAIAEATGEVAAVVGSGRTDAGVSAIGQVANFFLQKSWQPQKLVYAINAHLPADISVLQAEVVSPDFNARFCAKTKTYEYYFYMSNVRQPLLDRFALKTRLLNILAMQEACKYLVGEHDYTSFVARNSGKNNFVRTIYDAKIVQIKDNLYKFVVCGNGFLYNMVRIIVGTLLEIGENKHSPQHMADVIAAKSRPLAGKTVPSIGLFMKQVDYTTQ